MWVIVKWLEETDLLQWRKKKGLLSLTATNQPLVAITTDFCICLFRQSLAKARVGSNNCYINCFTSAMLSLLSKGASWGGSTAGIQESQNSWGGDCHSPTLRPAFLHKRNSPRTPAAAKVVGPQHIRWPLLPHLTFPALPVSLSHDTRPFRFWLQWAHEVSAPAVCPDSKVYFYIWGANRGVSQRTVLTPAVSDTLSLLWTAINPSPVTQTGAFADAQALFPGPTCRRWNLEQQGMIDSGEGGQILTYLDISECENTDVSIFFSLHHNSHVETFKIKD